jgi:penicillin-binding protein 1A
MLRNVVTDGTGAAAQLDDRQVAGKTGTTDESRDLWFIGYIPQLVAGVWLGNDDNTPTYGNSGSAAYAWHEFMEKAVEEMPVEKFPPRPNLENRKGTIKAQPLKPKKILHKSVDDYDQKSDEGNTDNSDSSTRRRRRRTNNQSEDSANSSERRPRRKRRYSQQNNDPLASSRRRRSNRREESNSDSTPKSSRSRRRSSKESGQVKSSSPVENNSEGSSSSQPSWRERLKPNSSP